MSDIVNLIAGKIGVGDGLLAYKTQQFIYNANKCPIVHFGARDEVFEVLKFIALDNRLNSPYQFNEDLYDEFLVNYSKLNEIGIDENDEFYFQTPDIFYEHSKAFDFKKYHVTPQTIKQTRILTKSWKPKKIVSLFLLSNTDKYSYYDIGNLAKEIAILLPDFEVYLPILNTWANKSIPQIKLPPGLPSNVNVDTNPNFINNIKKSYESYYSICADNGLSHVIYELGCRRLVLTSRFPINRNSAPWIRWFEDINDHINIENYPKDIARLVKTNIYIEQTNLLPKNYVLNNLNSDWRRELFFKYS